MRGDDSHLPIEVAGRSKANHVSFLERMADVLKESTSGEVRPQPFGGLEGEAYFWIFPERFVYKAGIAALSLACVLALMAFLRMFRVPRSSILVVAVALGLSLQFRQTHDPALGYYGTPQFTLLVLFTGLMSYLRFLRGGSKAWFVAALALAVVLVSIYESNPPLVLAFAALHLGRDPERVRSWRFAVPLLGIGGAMVLLSMYVHGNVAPAPGYATSLDPMGVILTALRQAVSGIPNIYFLSGSQGLLSDVTKAEFLGAFWRAALAALLVVTAMLMARAERDANVTDEAAATTEPIGALAIGSIGFILMACSGLLISLAIKFQQQIGLGGGHLATFSCTFGFIMLAVAAWIQWGPALASKRAAIAIVAIVVFGMTLAGQYSNLRVVAIERPGIEQRELFKAGLDRGLLREVADDTTVYLSGRDMSWAFGNLILFGETADYLVYLRAGRKMDVRPYSADAKWCGRQTGFPLTDCAIPSRRAAWVAVRASRDGGIVLVADGIPTAGVERRGSRRIVALARGITARGATPPLVGNLPDGKPWSARDARWNRVPLKDGWVRFSAIFAKKGPLAPTINDPRSPVDFAASPTPGALARQFGTKHLLP